MQMLVNVNVYAFSYKQPRRRKLVLDSVHVQCKTLLASRDVFIMLEAKAKARDPRARPSIIQLLNEK